MDSSLLWFVSLAWPLAVITFSKCKNVVNNYLHYMFLDLLTKWPLHIKGDMKNLGMVLYYIVSYFNNLLSKLNSV